MSSYVFMKVLESTPQRYDRGIRMLSGGRIEKVYERVAELATEEPSGEGPSGKAPGKTLDIGCGTGGVSLACAARGAEVSAIDINAGMLEVARSKPMPAAGRVEWIELGAVEIEDRFPEQSFDAIVSCLAFSELDPAEQGYVLRVARSRLRPGGVLVIADEVLPDTTGGRLAHRLRRWPLLVVTWVLTQTTTRPVEGLVERVRQAGFVDIHEERPAAGDFTIVFARRGEEAT